MSNNVLLLEDDPDLTGLVTELLMDADFTVIHVGSVEELLKQAAHRSPCVALIDGTSPSKFDLWWLGPILTKLGVPPVAFTAHGSARIEYEADNHDYVGVVPKPFDADRFVELVSSICWEDHHQAAS
ncbi:MAG: hypothetical protein NVSMB6_33000 [Burkholderiaceae bacterium]